MYLELFIIEASSLYFKLIQYYVYYDNWLHLILKTKMQFQVKNVSFSSQWVANICRLLLEVSWPMWTRT